MKRSDFIAATRAKTYLGDGLYVHFDGYHFILSCERENGENWVGLEPSIFDAFIGYREQVYNDAKNITDED